MAALLGVANRLCVFQKALSSRVPGIVKGVWIYIVRCDRWVVSLCTNCGVKSEGLRFVDSHGVVTS